MRIAFEWEDWKKEGKNERYEGFFLLRQRFFGGNPDIKQGSSREKRLGILFGQRKHAERICIF